MQLPHCVWNPDPQSVYSITHQMCPDCFILQHFQTLNPTVHLRACGLRPDTVGFRKQNAVQRRSVNAAVNAFLPFLHLYCNGNKTERVTFDPTLISLCFTLKQTHIRANPAGNQSPLIRLDLIHIQAETAAKWKTEALIYCETSEVCLKSSCKEYTLYY